MARYSLFNPEGRKIKECDDLHLAEHEAARISHRCPVEITVRNPEGETRVVARFEEGKNTMPVQRRKVQENLHRQPPWVHSL